MLAKIRAAYNHWRLRRACDMVRREMFALTGDHWILDLSDAELLFRLEALGKAVRQMGVTCEEAAAHWQAAFNDAESKMRT